MMRHIWKRFGKSALCGAALLSAVSLAHAQPGAPSLPAPPALPSAATPVDDLKVRIDQLEKLVKTLQAQPVSRSSTADQGAALKPNDVQKLVNDYLNQREAANPRSPVSAQQPGPGGVAPIYPQVDGTIMPHDMAGDHSVDFKNGVFIKSGDGLFSLRFNTLVQLDSRDFSHTAGGNTSNSALHDNFTLARTWLFFRGNVTEYIDYTTIIAGGAAANTTGGPGPFNVLDTYFDFNPFGAECKELLQIRMGRFKTPFLYQFYKISPQDFVSPELSMFGTNFLQNRQLGIMAHGLLFDKRFDYAAGVFNGTPNSFEVTQDQKEAVMYAGFQPFVQCQDSCFKNLIVAGSYAVGVQNGVALPNALGTAVPAGGPPNNLNISPTFLEFSAAALQTGFHDAWALDLVYNYKCLNFYGEYNGGKQTYELTTAPGKQIPVSLNGYSATATCFLTGEQITPSRARVQPLHPYNLMGGCWGAFELFGRYSNLDLGSAVLTKGLLMAGANANQVNATDAGVNWFLNEYVRFTLDWQHSMFNAPISLAPGVAGAKTTSQQDMLWLRFQLYY